MPTIIITICIIKTNDKEMITNINHDVFLSNHDNTHWYFRRVDEWNKNSIVILPLPCHDLTFHNIAYKYCICIKESLAVDEYISQRQNI